MIEIGILVGLIKNYERVKLVIAMLGHVHSISVCWIYDSLHKTLYQHVGKRSMFSQILNGYCSETFLFPLILQSWTTSPVFICLV